MFAIVINKDGHKVDFVHIFENGEIDSYILKENEKLIKKDWNIATSMNKPRWCFDTKEWEETEPVEPPQIDNCPPKTLEQRLEEAEQKLVETEQRLTESEEEKKLLKAQVEANTSTQEFLESCLMEIAEVVYA